MAEVPGYVEAGLAHTRSQAANYCLNQCGYRKLYITADATPPSMNAEDCQRAIANVAATENLHISCGLAGVATALAARNGEI